MYDLILFGVTGFTGKYVLETIVKTLKEKKEKFTYAVSARSMGKMDSILKEISDSTGEDLSSVPKIVADMGDTDSLVKMAKQGKVVINCAGPYRFSGRKVVDACIEAGTHHVDISAEHAYLESVQLECDEAAKKKGVYVVGSCGFDSIPAEMGIVHLIKNFGGDVNSVEEYIEIDNKGSKPTKINSGTWASATHGIANFRSLKPLREALANIEPKSPTPKHKLARRPVLHYNEVVNAWCLPFPGADSFIVQRSQDLLFRHQKQRPVQINAYIKMQSLLSSILLMIGGVVFGLFVFFPFGFGKKLLLEYPRLMSLGYVTHEGPTREEMENLDFSVTLYGKGWSEKLAEPTDQHSEPPNKAKKVKVSGNNPAYGATCVFLLQSALTIIKEKDNMPDVGGVYPPAAAFANTKLIERLQQNGIKFEISDA